MGASLATGFQPSNLYKNKARGALVTASFFNSSTTTRRDIPARIETHFLQRLYESISNLAFSRNRELKIFIRPQVQQIYLHLKSVK